MHSFASQGFTLIELMITVAIISIVFSLAFPSMTTLISRNRTKAAARQLRGDLQKAKLEAIKRNTDCLVVFTTAAGTDAGSCITCISTDTDCDDGNDEIITELDFNTFKQADVTTAAFTGGVQTFIFNSRGIPETTDGSNTMAKGLVDITNTQEAGYSFSVELAIGGRIEIQ